MKNFRIKYSAVILKSCILLFLFSGMIFALCSCYGLGAGIELETNCPSDLTLHILLPMTPEGDVSEADTELKRYNKDGFICADEWDPNIGIRYGKIMFKDSIKANELYQYVEKYKEIRIAAADEDGEILQVSPTFSLVIENRNYYWKEIYYDYDLNIINGTDQKSIDQSHFKVMLKWTNISFVSLLIMLIAVGMMLDEERNWKLVCPVIWAVCSIPVFIMISYQIVEFFDPYYASDKWSNKNIAMFMGICDLPWLIATIAFAGVWVSKMISEKRSKK